MKAKQSTVFQVSISMNENILVRWTEPQHSILVLSGISLHLPSPQSKVEAAVPILFSVTPFPIEQ